MFVQTENFGSNNILQFNFQLHHFDLGVHIHQYAELVYCIDGELIVTINDIDVTLHADDYIFIMPLRLHGFATPFCSNSLVMAFSLEYFPEISNTGGFLKGNGSEDRFSKMFKYAFLEGGLGAVSFSQAKPERIVDPRNIVCMNYVDLTSPEYLLRFKAAIYSLLSGCERGENVGGSDDEVVSRLLFWVGNHFTEEITLGDAATSLGYSKNYLSHKIKSVSGLSFTELLSGLRIECAIKYLSEGKTVLDAALDSGFGSERNFYRVFKAITGMTPNEYIKSNKKY